MFNKLCQLVVTENDQAIYIETASGEIVVNELQSQVGHYKVQCEILQFDSQEDCDKMWNLVSIRNEDVFITYPCDIRSHCLIDLIEREGLENLQ